LGEIENCLLECEGVREAVVTTQEHISGGKSLVAYVVQNVDGALYAGKLRENLRRELPDYMVPTEWMFLERLPLNMNGKVDRKALPRPARAPVSQNNHFVPPQTVTARRLAAIWTDILQIGQIGEQDNFFSLGGHSMLAIRCLVQINAEFGREISMRTFFGHQTLGTLATCIEHESKAASEQLVRMSCWFDDPNVPTMYGFPGAGMVGAAYLQLAQAISSTFNFRIMEPFWPADDGVNLDVQALAARYASAICAREGDSIITLVGHSFGGTLAFETARLLEHRSKHVRLVLLDATLLNPRILEELAGVVTVQDLDDSSAAEFPLVDSEYCDEKSSGKLLLSAHELYREHCRMFSNYAPSGTFGGVTVAILAEDGILQRRLREHFLRETYTFFRRDLILTNTVGNHLSMLSVPAVESLAAVMTRELAGLTSPANTKTKQSPVELQNVY
jgi:thioesterase domain-containing protein/acyl carrier protein